MPEKNELPLFDPAWGYATIYQRLNNATNQLIHAMNELEEVEEPSAFIDKWLTVSLEIVAAELNSIKALVDAEREV